MRARRSGGQGDRRWRWWHRGRLAELAASDLDKSGAGGSATPLRLEGRPGEDLEHVRDLLRVNGVADREIDVAARRGVLSLLVVEALLLPARRTRTQAEMSQITGMPAATLDRFWRAMGFPDVPEEDRIFTDLDLEAVDILQKLMGSGVAEVEPAIQMARVLGSCMARIADAEIGMAQARSDGVDDIAEARRLADTVSSLVPGFVRLLEYVWRRHLEAATRRLIVLRSEGASADAVHGLDVVVGFADMVGFTALSQQLSTERLAEVVTRFEQLAHDTVTALGGRVVKMIGDEAMFVVDDVEDAAQIALNLAAAYADDDLLSDVRVGLAKGPALARDGDYYGPVVNLASRLVNLANPGSILASAEVHDALEDVPGFAWQAMRPRYLKDIGRTALWALEYPGAESETAVRRLGERWQRVAEGLVRDLNDLRDRGERILAGGTEDEGLPRGEEPPDVEGLPRGGPGGLQHD